MELSLSIPPPYDYVPSRMEIITAQLVASVTNGAQIPPMHLPTWFPVLGVIGSILSCVLFTILLPQWWKPFEVYLDYNQKKLNQSSSSTPSIEKLLSLNDSNPISKFLSKNMILPRKKKRMKIRIPTGDLQVTCIGHSCCYVNNNKVKNQEDGRIDGNRQSSETTIRSFVSNLF